jgi:peroxiredoxin
MAQQYKAGQKEVQTDRKKAPPEPPPAPKMPEVKLPEQLLKTCLVKEGVSMPEAELADLEGKRIAIPSLLGKKLTVVLFWNSDNLYSTQALEYLQSDVAKPFGDQGLRVVGIDVKDPPESARKAVEVAGAKFVNLLDPDGAYFAKVATEKIPRVYLLDAAGKILWFDIEYSTSTGRDLERAIRFALGK